MCGGSFPQVPQPIRVVRAIVPIFAKSRSTGDANLTDWSLLVKLISILQSCQLAIQLVYEGVCNMQS